MIFLYPTMNVEFILIDLLKNNHIYKGLFAHIWSHLNLNGRGHWIGQNTILGNITDNFRRWIQATQGRERRWVRDLRSCSVVLMYTEESWCIGWKWCWFNKGFIGERVNQRGAAAWHRRIGDGDENSFLALEEMWCQGGLEEHSLMWGGVGEEGAEWKEIQVRRDTCLSCFYSE